MKNVLTTLCCMTLSISLVEVPFALNAHASMIPTGEVVSALRRAGNRAKVDQFMHRQDVRNQFEKFGVNAQEASLRVASMSDDEIQKIAGQIDRAPAGGDVIVISLTTVLLVVIILLLIGKL